MKTNCYVLLHDQHKISINATQIEMVYYRIEQYHTFGRYIN